MKQLLIAVLMMGALSSCTKTEEGLIGNWEGKAERLNDEGEIYEIKVSCEIKRSTGVERDVKLSVGGVSYVFDATEEIDKLEYIDRVLGVDSLVTSYISGTAEIVNDTILHFDHLLYEMKNNALLGSERVRLDMVRE